MTVKQLIEKLQTVDPNKTVYLSENDLDDSKNYYYLLENVREHNVEDIDLVVLTYRM